VPSADRARYGPVTVTTLAEIPLPRRLRRPGADRVWRRWTAAWLAGPVIGVANGAVRDRVYAERLGEQRAHQVSSVVAVGLFAAHFWLLERRWPVESLPGALGIGATWVALTVLFELAFGRAVGGLTWNELLRDYDLRRGRLWPVVLAWLAVGPAVVSAARRRA
jgi:hypothetical protein